LNGFERVCETGPRRQNALDGLASVQPERGEFQETHTYQALNDSGDRCLRCFA